MTSLLEELKMQLSPETLQAISRRLEADEETTAQAVSSALPLMIGGLSYNTHNRPEGAQDLDRALERDHDGSLLSQLGGLLGGGAAGGGLGGLLGSVLGQGGERADSTRASPKQRAADGDGILEHILGPRRSAVERGVSQTSGLELGKTSQLLSLLAPIVMSALGKLKRQDNLDAPRLTQVLDQDREQLERQMPDTQQGGLLNILDSNKDGKVDMRDDVAKVGMALGAAFLMSRGGKR